MHETRVVRWKRPPRLGRTCRAPGRRFLSRFSGAEEKCKGGGALCGVWTRLFRRGGAHPCTPVSEGGVENLLVGSLVNLSSLAAKLESRAACQSGTRQRLGRLDPTYPEDHALGSAVGSLKKGSALNQSAREGCRGI